MIPQLYEYAIARIELHPPLTNAGVFTGYEMTLREFAENGWRLIDSYRLEDYDKDVFVILTFERVYVKPDWKK